MAQLLLAQIAGEDGDIPPLSLPDVVEQSLGDDPMAGPLAAALRQREAKAAAAAAVEEDRASSATSDPEVADVIERLYGEVEKLRDRTRTLADALGACPRCWGEDDICPVCHGRGRPGGRLPDDDLFTELVEPAWRRRYNGFGADSVLINQDEAAPQP